MAELTKAPAAKSHDLTLIARICIGKGTAVLHECPSGHHVCHGIHMAVTGQFLGVLLCHLISTLNTALSVQKGLHFTPTNSKMSNLKIRETRIFLKRV